MKALKIIGAIIGAFIALLLIMGLIAPKEMKLERSILISAPQDSVLQQLKYFKNFHDWSPWTPLDPHLKYQITGKDGEVGTEYSWSGNEEVGTGRQVITEISDEKIAHDLFFETPMGEMKATSYFKLERNQSKTKVTWGFYAKSPYPWNAFNLFSNPENGDLAKEYEEGLKRLEAVCEG